VLASRSVRGHRPASRRWRALALSGAVLLLSGGWPEALAGEGFETPALRASELLPAELMSGPHHRVEESVVSDGFLPVFTISSDFGTFEARGVEALRDRVFEIEALAALRGGSEPAEKPPSPLGPGAVPGAGTVKPGLPVGAWGAQPKTGSLTLGGAADGGFVDLDSMKRTVAHRLGIDPYTGNEALQRELQQHVWAAYAGAARSPLTAPEEPGGAGGFDDPERSEELVRDYSAEDLRRLHRIELAVMGVDEELREEFLENPHYTSRHGARLLDSLSSLETTSDRSAFIAAAARAGSQEEARGFERMAALMRRYGDQTGSLERFVTVGGRVAAYTDDGTLLVPVLGDHASWTQGVASFAETMATAAGEDPDVTRTRLLFSGSLSQRARQEMEKLGLSVGEQTLPGAGAPPVAPD
jgi:hypothetical protein